MPEDTRPSTPNADAPFDEELVLDVAELGPRARALIDWMRESGGRVVVRSRGRTLARLVAEEAPTHDEPVRWDLEAIGP